MMSVKHNQIDLNADAASIDRENEVDTPVSGDSQAETLEGFSSCQGEVQDNVLDKVRICGSSEVICDLNIDADDVVMSSVGVGREVIVSDSVTDVEKDNECFGGEVGVEAGECIDRCGDDVSMCDDNKAESADVVEKASGEGVNHHMNGGPVGGVLEQWNHITGNSSSSHQDAGQSPTHKSEKVTSDGLENQVMEIDAQAEYNDDQLVDIHVSEVEISSDVMNESYGISLEVDLNACGTTSRDLTDMSIKLIASKQDFCASDLVWGKVRSHPWWPGQILAPSAASKKARKYFKKDSYLIAYFGDQTFAWNEASKIKPFREHFTQMESQSSLEDFHCAIDCALEEVSRRVEFGLSCSCIPEEALTEISTQMIVNAGVKEESSIIDGGDNYSSAASFDPVKLFEHVKALAQLLHYSGVDRLSLVTVQAQLSAFYRWKGYLQLPEFNVLGGLLDSDAEIPLSAEVKHGAEVLENAAPDFKHDKQEYCGTGKSNSQDGFSHKWMQISGDRACPRKKEKSLSDLLAESHTNMSNGKNGSDGKGDKLISSSSARKRKAVDSTYYDIAAKHKKLDSISEDKILKHKRGDRLIVKHGKSDLSSRADNSLPTKNLGVGTSILKIASQLNGSSGDQTSPKTLVKNKRNDKSDLRKSQRKKHFVAEDSSIDDFLSKLCLVARDPTTRYSFSISLVSFFSKFRKSVSLEISEGEGSGDRTQKMLKQSETAGIPASNLIKDSYWTDRVIENIPEVQQPLENKNEVEEALHNDPSQINICPLEAQLAVHLGAHMESGRQSDDENLEWESVNDGENLELKAVQPVDHLDGCCDEDLSPTALILNFSDSESVPSKEHLNNIFGHFGALNELETELLKSRRAKVVFKKRKDAEAAFSSAGKYSIFGPALVSYCLKYMSSASNASSRMTTKRSRKVATSIEENQQHRSVKFLEPFEAVETSFNSPEVKEEESQPVESLEPGKTRSGKYNLRKSLAWDNAFFTSEGVLDSEELSSMIGGTEISEKNVLPGIQEDIHRSTDSLSSLDSDALTLKSLETDLFEDIRASIQKSSQVSNVANSNNEKRLGVTESQTMQSSKNVDLASRDKMKPKIASRKPIVGTLGTGKSTKQAVVHLQSSKSVVTNGESASSPCKPKAHGRINPIPKPMESTKRASISAKRAKPEKDNHKNASGKGAPTTKIPSSGSWKIVPMPILRSRSSLCSSAATKTELTTSCSSFNSSGSASSNSIGKISLNSMKRKNNSGISNASFASSTVKSIPRTAPKGKIQSGSSHLTSYLRSVSKHSSSISPASSISEWSSESIGPTSTTNQRRNSTRASIDSSSSKSVSADNDALRLLDFHHDSNDQISERNDAKFPALQGECVKGPSMKTDSMLCPSSKPSGLRLPSPKIGFFDGVKSAGRTSSGSMQPHPGVPSALPNIKAGITSPSGGSNKSKLGKIQPAKIALPVQNIKPDAQQTGMTMKPRSPLPLQESIIAATKVSGASKKVKNTLVSPRFHSRMSPKTGGESIRKADEVGSKGHYISSQDSSLAEKKNSSIVLKQKVSPRSNNKAPESDLKFTSDAENINPSQKVDEDAQLGKQFLNNDLSLLHNSNAKQKVPQDEVDSLTRQVGFMKINLDIEKKVISPSPESILKLAENN